MPTIRIDDEVFDGLKKLAEPFTDSPGSVIRRLLVEKGVLKATPVKSRQPALVVQQQNVKVLTPPLTQQETYEQFLLVTLEVGFEGTGEKRAVTRAVIEKMVQHGFIGPAELELVATGETKAENTITWGRNALKNRGLIERGSKRGTWILTEDGREAARTLILPKAGKR